MYDLYHVMNLPYFLAKSQPSEESPNTSIEISDFTSATKDSSLRMKESLFVASEQVLDTSE